MRIRFGHTPNPTRRRLLRQREGSCKEVEIRIMTWVFGVKDSHCQHEHGLVLVILCTYYCLHAISGTRSCSPRESEEPIKGERTAQKLPGSWALSVLRVEFLTQGENIVWENGVFPSKLSAQDIGIRTTCFSYNLFSAATLCHAVIGDGIPTNDAVTAKSKWPAVGCKGVASHKLLS